MPSATTSASEPDRVEVVTSVQRRRRWSLNEKLRAVEEAAAPGMTVSYIARKYGIHPSLVFKWRRLMSEGGQEAVRADDQVVAAAEVRELKRQIRELERLLHGRGLPRLFVAQTEGIVRHHGLHLVLASFAPLGPNGRFLPIGHLPRAAM